MSRSFHYRDPRETPVLAAIGDLIFRGYGNDKPMLSGLDIKLALERKGFHDFRVASDVSEIRHWATEFRVGGNLAYYVPAAKYAGLSKEGNRVSLFVMYRYDDPRAVADRQAVMERKETTVERRAA
jgi:hypothetical protein